MSKRIIQIPVTMQAPVRKADDSVKLGFITNFEVSNEDFANMDTFRKASGWLLFSENEMSEADLPTSDAPVDAGQKTPSHRLRNVIYKYWLQAGQVEPFYSYYEREIEKAIERYKEALE